MRRHGNGRAFALLLILAVLAVGVAVWLSPFRAARTSDIRNVVIISIDTCRADHLSCYGFDRNTTPNIDAVANDGVVFERAQTTSPLTLPAHSSMMTGTIPPVHGVLTNQGHTLSSSNVTMAEVLQDNGFRTGAVIGAFPMDRRFGVSQGFDLYDDQMDSESKLGFFNERTADEVSRASMTWLEQQEDKPFFLFVHYFDPHQRYSPPEPFATAYPDDQYSGEIAYTDHCVGKVINKLKELDLYDSTAIIITSDHGESLGDHLEISHGFFIYQSTIRIPLVVRMPSCAKGRQIRAAVSLIDVMPTVLGMLGISVPPSVQGIDLSDCIRGGAEPASDRYLYSDSWYPAKLECCPLRGLLHGEWRYIRSVRPELYNLEQDPDETTNVIKSNQQLVETLDRQLNRMLAGQRQREDSQGSLVPDRQTVQRLQSLGYVGGGDVEASSDIDERMNDPKDYIRLLNQYTIVMTHYGERRLEEAKVECLKIMSVEPRIPHTHLLLAKIATEQGDVANATKHYEDVLAIASKATLPHTLSYELVVAHFNLGLLNIQDGDSDQAKQHFQQVLMLDPNHVESLIKLGTLYAREGKQAKAVASLEAALTSNPLNVAAAFEVGKLFLKNGDTQQAERYFERVLKSDPDHADAHHRLATIVLQQGDEIKAQQHLEQALQIQPNSAETSNDLAWLLATARNAKLLDVPRAVQLAQRAAELSENRDPTILDTLAVALAAASDFPAAITTAEKAAALAEAADQVALTRQIRQHIKLFEKSTPYKHSPPADSLRR